MSLEFALKTSIKKKNKKIQSCTPSFGRKKVSAYKNKKKVAANLDWTIAETLTSVRTTFLMSCETKLTYLTRCDISSATRTPPRSGGSFYTLGLVYAPHLNNSQIRIQITFF